MQSYTTFQLSIFAFLFAIVPKLSSYAAEMNRLVKFKGQSPRKPKHGIAATLTSL